MSTRHPQAGDGIVDLRTNKRWVCNGVLTHSITKQVMGVQYNDEKGIRRELWNGQYRLETFGEFLTRSTGIGRTGWFGVGLICACILGLCITGIVTWRSGGWVAVAMAALVLLWMYIGTRGNFTGRIR